MTGTLDDARRALLARRLDGRATRSPIIPVADRSVPLRLSFGQERLWVLDQLAPASAEYVVPIVLHLTGRLDVAALRAAVSVVVGRHESLRTLYQIVDGNPVQVIGPPTEVPLPVDDTTGAELAGLVTTTVATPFDLARGPVLRARLLRLGQDEHVFVLTEHHIACDGWSTDVMVREIVTCYRAYAVGDEPRLLPVAVQYADFAQWQRRQLSGARLDRLRTFWRRTLAGLTPFELPLDRPRTAPRDPAGARTPFAVSADVGRELAALADRCDATVYMVLLSALTVLLGGISGTRDIAVGTPMAGRSLSALENTVGFFVNTVVLRCDLSGDPTFVELVARVKEIVLAASEHQDLPFERLVAELDVERDLSRNPLVDVLFLVEEPGPESAMGEVGITEVSVDSPAVKSDLLLGLRTAGDGSMLGAFEYATALFDRVTIERWAGYYRRILGAIAMRPQSRISELSAPPLNELVAVAAWNDTVAVVDDVTLVELVERTVRRSPGATAVITDTGELTYAELDVLANRLAYELRGRGVRRGDIVGVCLERGVDLVATLLGIQKAGAAYLPIDPAHPAARIGYVLADADVVAVVSTTEHEPALAEIPVDAATVFIDRDTAAIASRPSTPVGNAPTPTDLAYVIYTSGSTGRPKGVMVSHRGIVNRVNWMQKAYRLTEDDRVLQKTPYTFDVSVWEFFLPLVVGARLVMAPPGLHLDPPGLADFIAGNDVTHLHFVPSMLDVFLDLSVGFPACIRTLFCSGEVLRATTARRLRDRSPDAELHNLYGPTEASVDVTAFGVGPGATDPVPIGRAIDNTGVHVLDEELRPTAIGVVGEFYLSGVGLARGYVRRPGLTAERFVPAPTGLGLPAGARLYRTGDRGRWRPDGQLICIGRVDDQVKLRGLRIELGEIETVLTEHPAVSAAAVVVFRPSNADPQLVGYVVTRTTVRDDELRTHLTDRLPAYMVPAHFVALPELPHMVSGKVDRTALPAPESADWTRQGVPPCGPVEEVVAAVWAEVLGLPVAALGRDDGFFDRGGDSMRAVRAVGRLRDLGIEVSMQDLFQHRTVAALATVVRAPILRPDDRRTEPYALLSAADREQIMARDDLVDGYPVSRIQAGMLFEMLADADIRPYHNVTSYAIRDGIPFDRAALYIAAQALVDRHEALRTGFDLASYREPVQLVQRSAEPQIVVDDLRDLSAEEARLAIERAVAGERDVPFDVEYPPLFRLHAHLVADDRWYLSLVECHAILDGWSHNMLLTELIGLYREATGTPRTPAARPPTRVRFADFVDAERVTLESVGDQQFWHDRLAACVKFTIPRTWADRDDDRMVTVQRPYGSQSKLRDRATAAGVPMKSVFLAAFVKTLAAFDASPGFFFGLVVNGRLETPGGDEVYGMHLNTVPFVAPDLPPTAGWSDLLGAVLAEEAALQPYRRYPLTELQRGRAEPLIEATFNYLDFYTVDQSAVDLAQTVDNSPNEFPLVFTVLPGAIQVTARTGRLSQAWARTFAETYVAILATMAEQELSESSVVTEAELRHDGGPANEPVSELERALVAIWSELLGVDRVDRHDDFFALGGHSLLAMRAAARLSREHGVTISPREIMSRRTVAAVAAGRRQTSGSRSLVWLRRTGRGHPIVLVHPGGGGVHWYRELADELDAPVVALQHPAAVEPRLASLSVQELAARYRREILAEIGEGPWALFGWCGAAPTVWELAGNVGPECGPVILLDPALEGMAEIESTQLSVLRRCEDLLVRYAAGDTTVVPDEVLGLLRLVVDDDRMHPVLEQWLDPSWANWVAAWRRLAEARLAYRFARFDRPIHLIAGDELVTGGHVALSTHTFDDYLSLWRSVAEVKVSRVPGGHVDVLRSPHVTKLASVIREITEPWNVDPTE